MKPEVRRVALVLLVLVCGIAASPAEDDAKTAFIQLRQQLDKAGSMADRFGMCRAFLLEHANSPHAREVIGMLGSLASSDPTQAISVLDELLPRITDVENLRVARISLLLVLGRVGDAARVESLAAELGAGATMDYDLATAIATAADAAQLPERAEKAARQALSLLDVETFSQRYGERVGPIVVGRFSAEHWMRIARARLAVSDPAGTLDAVAQARTHHPANFLGISSHRYAFYEGMALEAKGDVAAAIDAFAIEALFDHHEPALDRLRQLHDRQGGTFESFLAGLRDRLAKPAPDFTLDRLVGDGGPLTLSQQRGTVILLNFWSYG